MKILSKDFQSRGARFKQVKREGNIAIYQRIGPNEKSKHFETVIIKVHGPYEIAGIKFSSGECMPASNNDWGTLGFSYSTLESAENKFQELKIKYKDQNMQVNTQDEDNSEETQTEIKQQDNNQAPKGKRGRVKAPPLVLELPSGEFSVNSLTASSGFEKPKVYARIKELIEEGVVKLTRKESVAGKRGKPTNFYSKV